MADLRVYAEAAARYRPAKVRLLWIAESPPRVRPGKEPRYFYFEEMTSHDSLFREVMKAMFPGCRVPFQGGSKAELLCRFRDSGAFLIDAAKEPGSLSFTDWWPTVRRQIIALDPERIVVVGVLVCSFVHRRLAEMGYYGRLLVTERVELPFHGWAGDFHEAVDTPVRRWMSRRLRRRAHRSEAITAERSLRMKRIFVPTRGADDWRRCLADARKQWRDGCSAKCLAECWEGAAGLPTEVERLFCNAGLPEVQRFELLLAIPEYQVRIPGGGHPSQTDLFLLARTALGLITVAVEGKVAEPFGPTLGEWRQDFSRGKRIRLAYIQDVLGLSAELGDHIYYQLLHRLASAVYEAERFGATSAALIVHSFSPERAGFDAYRDFAALFGIEAREGELIRLGQPKGVRILCGWAQGAGGRVRSPM